MFFISLQKLFWFSKKSNFGILDIQIPWRYQMPKGKARNSLLSNLESKHSLLMKFGQFVS